MDLSTRYTTTLKAAGFTPDGAQLRAVETLARAGAGLQRIQSPGSGWSRLKRRLPGRWSITAPVRGAYLWGGVGRGKTFVMDLFFDNLPFEDKLRFHFHRIMYRVHRRLKALPNQRDPISIIAEEFARQARVICFDEFFVADIADAMILGRFLDELFRRGVTLVVTSNIPPDDLYRDGLQRQQFLPAIDLIQAHTEVLHVDGDTYYRLRVLEQAEIYHSPIDAAATANLENYFSDISPDSGTRNRDMEVLGRNIRTRRRADGIAWFDFGELCDGPRSQDDYIEIARCFQTVILSDVPLLDERRENQARRFIALVDEFYDRRVKLIISAAEAIEGLYRGSQLGREFERTRSRLREMQSIDYLAAPHVP
jgi:cell division protein ZapE